MEAAQTPWRRPTAFAPPQPTTLDEQAVAPLLAMALRLEGWKVAQVQDMTSVFIGTKSFNYPLEGWNVA